MTNKYQELKSKFEKEFQEFPMAFAYNKQQFEEAMTKLGLTTLDTDKVYGLEGTGAIYRKTDAPALKEMMDRHAREMQEAIDSDLTGEGFIFDMFDYELGNHEYNYTWDVTDALSACDLTMEQVKANKRLLHGLQKAKKAQADWAAANL